MKVLSIDSNQTQVELDDGSKLLISYATPVAAHVPGRGYLVTNKTYSRTTSKHIKAWVENNDYETVFPQELMNMVP